MLVNRSGSAVYVDLTFTQQQTVLLQIETVANKEKFLCDYQQMKVSTLYFYFPISISPFVSNARYSKAV